MESSRAWLKRFTLPLLLCVLAGANAAWAAEMTFPVVTGRNWVQSSQAEKLAYVNGMATIIELEKETQATAQPGVSDASLVGGWVLGLSGMRLEDIVSTLDAYYRNNPGQAARPVVEVMWTEIASPNAAKAR